MLLCGEIPRAELAEIGLSGHHVLLDRPEALLAAMRRFSIPEGILKVSH